MASAATSDNFQQIVETYLNQRNHLGLLSVGELRNLSHNWDAPEDFDCDWKEVPADLSRFNDEALRRRNCYELRYRCERSLAMNASHSLVRAARLSDKDSRSSTVSGVLYHHLMAGKFDRVYEIAGVARDKGLGPAYRLAKRYRDEDERFYWFLVKRTLLSISLMGLIGYVIFTVTSPALLILCVAVGLMTHSLSNLGLRTNAATSAVSDELERMETFTGYRWTMRNEELGGQKNLRSLQGETALSWTISGITGIVITVAALAALIFRSV